MKRVLYIIASLLVVIGVFCVIKYFINSNQGEYSRVVDWQNGFRENLNVNNKNTSMKIISPAFANNGRINKKYTCNGENINPPLEFVDVPEEAKSLILIMDDPDVPKQVRADQMWDHWIKFNIPPTTREIKDGEEPAGISGRGTSGNLKYHGPCPPDREHRYFFKLYALDTVLDLPEGASKKEIEQAMQNHIIAQAELIGLYEQSVD